MIGHASIGQLAQWSCVLEATAPKAGNVHPQASFEDLTWVDLVLAAVVTRPIFDRAALDGVGTTVLSCVKATGDVVGSNANLGILLLLAPLCAVPLAEQLEDGLPDVLNGLTERDAQLVFAAIALAKPGGMNRVGQQDIRQPPTVGLIEAMRLAAHRDAVARQYTNGFSDILRQTNPFDGAHSLETAIVGAHLSHMAAEPDSLIARKCGSAIARQSQVRAQRVLEGGWPQTEEGQRRFSDLDVWLRADRNRRNPGTSADLVAADLFVALRQGLIAPPFPWIA